jgi:hypothetical protein
MFIIVCESFCPLSFQLLNCLHFFNGFEINIKFIILYGHIECFLCAHISTFSNFEIKLADPIKGKTTFIHVSYNTGSYLREVRAFPR